MDVRRDTSASTVSKLSKEERKAQKKALKKAERKQQRKDLESKPKSVVSSASSSSAGHMRKVKAAKHSRSSSDRETNTNTAFVVTTKQHFADRIVAIPEVVQREVREQAFIAVPRTVVEKEKVIKVKETVEIPEIEYIDEYITEEYIQDVHRTIEKPITVEKEVEHIIHVDDIETVLVEVPDVTYDDVVVVKDVPVPTIIEKEVIVERVVPQIQEELIEDVNFVYKDREVKRNIPVPVEATIKQKFIAPRIESVHRNKHYKALLPEFSEQVVWASSLTDDGRAALPSFQSRIEQLAGSSLCEVEKLFCDIKSVNMEHDDWLHSDMITSHMNLPYMGVENVNVRKPTFLKSASHDALATHDSFVHQEQKVKAGRHCKPKNSRSANVQHTAVAGARGTIIEAHHPQFVQVDSHLGLTTISPTARYAKKTHAH